MRARLALHILSSLGTRLSAGNMEKHVRGLNRMSLMGTHFQPTSPGSCPSKAPWSPDRLIPTCWPHAFLISE